MSSNTAADPLQPLRETADLANTVRLRVLASPAFWHRATNPYTWLLYTHMSATPNLVVHGYHWKRLVRRRYHIFHLHWPEGHLNDPNPGRALRRTVSLLGMLHWARARGTKVVWTVHNLRSHEGLYPGFERLFWSGFLRCVDGYISLSHAGQEAALGRFPELRRLPGCVIPPGHYRDAYASTVVAKAGARHQLGIDLHATVLAFIGQVRPYKNVPGLLAAFGRLTDPSSVLLIAGQCMLPKFHFRFRTWLPVIREYDCILGGSQMSNLGYT